jgi:hypothetical protein
MKTVQVVSLLAIVSFVPLALSAQAARERQIPLRHWPAPLFWQPTQGENHAGPGAEYQADAAGTPSPQAAAPPNSLVFVGMTPCRVVDTRGAAGSFGGPGLTGGVTRSFPLAIQAGNPCPIPANAQAYSLNVTVVPGGFLGYLTIWPQGVAQPLVSTLNDLTGLILANAAIVPAGSPNGGVSVFASNNTELVIDINGYYAAQSGITLAQGTAGAPSLSFSGDAGTGVFSSGAGALDFATGGTNRLTIRPDGDVDLAGSVRKSGALFLHSLGGGSTGVGSNALSVNSGTNNTAVGNNALSSNTTGFGNTAAGWNALQVNTTGSGNSAFGNSALAHNTTATANTAVGIGALTALATATGNVAVGWSALSHDTDSPLNTAVGYAALTNLVTGSGNIAIGAFAGTNLTNGSPNNIDIGNTGVAGDSGVIRIGDSALQTRTFMAGVNGVTTGGAAVPVMIDGNGQLGTTSSSRRYKENIDDMADGSSGLYQLRPVRFQYKQPYADGSKPMDYGLIAEEVEAVYPDLVIKNKDGEVETVQYQKLIPMLLNEAQKEHRRAEQQDETIRLLQGRLAALEALTTSKSSAAAGQ